MTTPILTKTQQRKSLSAKKGPAKGLKNVLAQPYVNNWPLLKNDLSSALENILKKLLPVLKYTTKKIPWSELRNMSKEERRNARKAARIESNVDSTDSAIRNSVIFGINAVTRLLEKDDVCCILLDSNVDPSSLIKHVVVMAHNKNVPILLVPFLKTLTVESIEFASAALGLKRNVVQSSDNYFFSLFQKVSELSLELSSAKTPVALFQDKINDKHNEVKMNIEKMEEDIEEVGKPWTISTDVYLYRTSRKGRVFEPPNSSKDAQRTEKTSLWTDFIAFDDNNKYIVDKKEQPLRFFESTKSASNSESNSDKILYKTRKRMGESHKSIVESDKCNVSYKPLKVKRLQGNEFRTKATKPAKVKKRIK